MTANANTSGSDTQGAKEKPDKPQKPIEIIVDDESVTIPSKDTTPNEILTAAGLDPATHYLVQLQGRQKISYQGKGDEPIKVHPHETFVSLSTGPTPTS